MKRILVTGAGGQLGRTLKDLAGSYDTMEFHFMPKSSLDIVSAKQVEKQFEIIKPDYCINCAAYNQVEQAEKTPEPALKVNTEGVKNLVQACKVHGTVLIHISTDYVFDGAKGSGYLPTDETNPINAYGHSKLGGEQVIVSKLKRYFIVRTSWLYSKKYGHNFYRRILSKAANNETIVVTDQQSGCPTETDSLGGFLLELVQSGRKDYGILHYTDGEIMTWFDFARRILKEEGYEDRIVLQRGENNCTFARRPKYSVLKQVQNTDKNSI